MTSEEFLIQEMKKNVIRWINIEEGMKVLAISDDYEMYEDVFSNMNINYSIRGVQESLDNPFDDMIDNGFDYVFCISVLEKCHSPLKLLSIIRKKLSFEGKLILGVNNRLGLKYFCGEQEPNFKMPFVGIENYSGIDKDEIIKRGRLYSKSEIKTILQKNGFNNNYFFSVLPNLEYTQLIFSEKYLPNEELSIRMTPLYDNPNTIFLHEENIYQSIISNGIFHEMANSYLIVCSKDKYIDYPIKQITFSSNRGKDKALMTSIYDDYVEKKAIFPEGNKSIEKLLNNSKILKDNGINVINMTFNQNSVHMPFVKGKIANVYLQELLEIDCDKFISEMDRFIKNIYTSSKIVRVDPKLGPILQYGFIDLVPLNCFFYNNEFLFFDQEFCIEEYPINAIIFRTIEIIYEYNTRRESILPSSYFLKKYKIEEDYAFWQSLSDDFTDKLTNQDKMVQFNAEHKRNYHLVQENRKRIETSITEYEEIMLNPFQNLLGKKLFIFGSGNYALKFVEMYRKDYPIEGVLDNNQEKWGKSFQGYPIMKPNILTRINPKEYKVIICVKNFRPILEQLKNLGTINVGTFDFNRVYPGRQALAIPNSLGKNCEKKKYHIGYIAGVFDLYHLGHLNMFKRAKEKCDYLIVGVVSDAGVRQFKHTEPFIPLDERIEMVKSCRYVDEVVEIPYFYRDTQEAFEKYHFDVQFSGSDYENDPSWLAKKTYLQEHGSTLEFLSYTEQTSSTKIKALIEQKLL